MTTQSLLRRSAKGLPLYDRETKKQIKSFEVDCVRIFDCTIYKQADLIVDSWSKWWRADNDGAFLRNGKTALQIL